MVDMLVLSLFFLMLLCPCFVAAASTLPEGHLIGMRRSAQVRITSKVREFSRALFG
jgi:hypothetical protein